MRLISQWIVAVTEPKSEFRASVHIERQGLTTYIPRIRELIVLEGRRIWKEGVMFPRYLFVLTEGPWRFILSTFGVVGIIKRGGGDEPAELDEKIIGLLKEQEADDGFICLPVPPRFNKGQRVRMRHGCMVGQLGIYQGASSLERERVLMNILGRSTPVSVSSGCLVAA